MEHVWEFWYVAQMILLFEKLLELQYCRVDNIVGLSNVNFCVSMSIKEDTGPKLSQTSSFDFSPDRRLQSYNVYFLFLQVATFIVQKILLDDLGLDYICTTAERFYAVGRVLNHMVGALAEQPSSRLLKHIIRCYLRLADNPRLSIWSVHL